MVMRFNVELISPSIKLDVLPADVFLLTSPLSVIGFKCSVKPTTHVLGFTVLGSSILILPIPRIKEHKSKGRTLNKLR